VNDTWSRTLRRRIESRLGDLGIHIARYPWRYIISIGLLTTGLLAQLPSLPVDTSFVGMLPSDDPALRTFEEFRTHFGSPERAVLAIRPDAGLFEAKGMARLAALQADLEAEEKSSETNPKDFTVKYSNGLQINRNDGMAKIKIGRRIQADFATIHVDSDLSNAADTSPGAAIPPSQIGGDGEGVEFRRTRLYVSGDLYDRIVFNSQFEFAGGDVALKDQYLGMKKIPVLGTVLVGHMKEPFSLEQLMSSKYLTFMERSLPSILDSERNFGLLFKNHYLDQRMTASAGIFAVTGDTGEFSSRNEDFNVSGRITGLPFYDKENKRLVHLGLSVAKRFADQGSGGFRFRPEINQAERYLNTGAFQTDSGTAIAAEFAAVLGPFSVQSEWGNAWLDRGDGKNWEANSAYVETSFFLTGENRNYKTSSGIFGRVTPKRSFDPAAGGFGAWEIGARYSWVDLQDEGMTGGEEQNVTAALNWYLFSNV
jgi:phosphate-selective porin OprO/OprP